ncbi:MAG: hypothetical protein R6W90_06265 [Ignavibacteriaceae bacterium]
MIWHFTDTGFNPGKFNMEYDLHLANNCGEDESFLRLYRWKPYCISLGANQPYDSINSVKAERENIDIVKRPTGGRAVLHSEELTYSVVIPLNEKSSARNIYNKINSALLAGLKLYDEKLSYAELENIQPNLSSFYKEEISTMCFAVPAKSEIKYSGKKLVGSAQRKLSNVILQHGSIICGGYHTRIADYLNISPEDSTVFYEEIVNKTTDIKSITGKEVNYDRLSSSLKAGFEKYFSMEFEPFPEKAAALVSSSVIN